MTKLKRLALCLTLMNSLAAWAQFHNRPNSKLLSEELIQMTLGKNISSFCSLPSANYEDDQFINHIISFESLQKLVKSPVLYLKHSFTSEGHCKEYDKDLKRKMEQSSYANSSILRIKKVLYTDKWIENGKKFCNQIIRTSIRVSLFSQIYTSSEYGQWLNTKFEECIKN